MKKIKNQRVGLTRPTYNNMLNTFIESGRNESIGFLFGRKNNNRYEFDTAYPVITAKRNPSSAYFGNNAAFLRLRDHLRFKIELEPDLIIGGYHSHPVSENEKYKTLIEPSKNDIVWITGKMNELGIENWVELIFRINRRETKSNNLYESVWQYPYRLGGVIQDNPTNQIRFSCGAFKFEKKLLGIDLRYEKIKISKNNNKNRISYRGISELKLSFPKKI